MTISERSDEMASIGEQLIEFIASHDGSVSAATVGQFHAEHPGSLAVAGLGNDILNFVPDASTGTVNATKEGKYLFAAKKLADYVASCGGSLPANRLSDFYAKHPECKAAMGTCKLRKFCKNHSDILGFTPDTGPGTIRAVSQRKKRDDSTTLPASEARAPSPKKLRGVEKSVGRRLVDQGACCGLHEEPVDFFVSPGWVERGIKRASAVSNGDPWHEGQADPWGGCASLQPSKANSHESTLAPSTHELLNVGMKPCPAGTKGRAPPASLRAHAPSSKQLGGVGRSAGKRLADQKACCGLHNEALTSSASFGQAEGAVAGAPSLGTDRSHKVQDSWGDSARLQPSEVNSNGSTSASSTNDPSHIGRQQRVRGRVGRAPPVSSRSRPPSPKELGGLGKSVGKRLADHEACCGLHNDQVTCCASGGRAERGTEQALVVSQTDPWHEGKADPPGGSACLQPSETNSDKSTSASSTNTVGRASLQAKAPPMKEDGGAGKSARKSLVDQEGCCGLHDELAGFSSSFGKAEGNTELASAAFQADPWQGGQADPWGGFARLHPSKLSSDEGTSASSTKTEGKPPLRAHVPSPKERGGVEQFAGKRLADQEAGCVLNDEPVAALASVKGSDRATARAPVALGTDPWHEGKADPWGGLASLCSSKAISDGSTSASCTNKISNVRRQQCLHGNERRKPPVSKRAQAPSPKELGGLEKSVGKRLAEQEACCGLHDEQVAVSASGGRADGSTEQALVGSHTDGWHDGQAETWGGSACLQPSETNSNKSTSASSTNMARTLFQAHTPSAGKRMADQEACCGLHDERVVFSASGGRADGSKEQTLAVSHTDPWHDGQADPWGRAACLQPLETNSNKSTSASTNMEGRAPLRAQAPSAGKRLADQEACCGLHNGPVASFASISGSDRATPRAPAVLGTASLPKEFGGLQTSVGKRLADQEACCGLHDEPGVLSASFGGVEGETEGASTVSQTDPWQGAQADPWGGFARLQPSKSDSENGTSVSSTNTEGKGTLRAHAPTPKEVGRFAKCAGKRLADQESCCGLRDEPVPSSGSVRRSDGATARAPTVLGIDPWHEGQADPWCGSSHVHPAKANSEKKTSSSCTIKPSHARKQQRLLGREGRAPPVSLRAHASSPKECGGSQASAGKHLANQQACSGVHDELGASSTPAGRVEGGTEGASTVFQTDPWQGWQADPWGGFARLQPSKANSPESPSSSFTNTEGRAPRRAHARSPTGVGGTENSAGKRLSDQEACCGVHDEPVACSASVRRSDEATARAPTVLGTDPWHEGHADPWGGYSRLHPTKAISDESTLVSPADEPSHVRKRSCLLDTKGRAPPASLRTHSPLLIGEGGISAKKSLVDKEACCGLHDEPLVSSASVGRCEGATAKAPAHLGTDPWHKGLADPWSGYACLQPSETASDERALALSIIESLHVTKQTCPLGMEGRPPPASVQVQAHLPTEFLGGETSAGRRLAEPEVCCGLHDEQVTFSALARQAEGDTVHAPVVLSTDPWHRRQADHWRQHAHVQHAEATSDGSTSASSTIELQVQSASPSSGEQPCLLGTEGASEVASPLTELLPPSQDDGAERDLGLFGLIDDVKTFASMMNDVHAKKARAVVALAEWQEGLEIVEARLKKMCRFLEVERAHIKQREVAVTQRERQVAKREEVGRSAAVLKSSTQDGGWTSFSRLTNAEEAASSCTNGSNDGNAMGKPGNDIRKEPLWKPYTDPTTGRTGWWNAESGTYMWDCIGR